MDELLVTERSYGAFRGESDNYYYYSVIIYFIIVILLGLAALLERGSEIMRHCGCENSFNKYFKGVQTRTLEGGILKEPVIFFEGIFAL